MKNLFFAALCILFSSVTFSQEIIIDDLVILDGATPPSPATPIPFCTTCLSFNLSFKVTAPISSNILSETSLIVNSATGTISGYDSSGWGVDSLISPGCNVYTYIQPLSICFEIDPSYCVTGEHFREEVVGFQLEHEGECLADYLNDDPIIEYFDTECVSQNADTCDPTDFTFENICCVDEIDGRSYVSNEEFDPIISPNPCINTLYIENLLGGEEIIIYSVIGKKLKSLKIAEGVFEKRIDDLRNIPVGVNILHIIRDGKVVTQIKFVKNN